MKIKAIFIISFIFLMASVWILWKDSSPKKIAIVYIATGRYIDFWDTFYQSAEKNFLPNHPKHYFVFTDDTKRIFPDNVTHIKQKQMEWPYITLLRYHLIDGIKDKLASYDYTFFFNANAVVVDTVGTEILPNKRQKLIAAIHPLFYKASSYNLPFENRVKSLAFVPFLERKRYFQASLTGGRTDAYLEMNALLKQRVQTDLDKNIIAVWHDESHYNWYMTQQNPLILKPNYVFGSDLSPETVKQFAPKLKIVMLNKKTQLLGGHACMREQTDCVRLYDYNAVKNEKLLYFIHPQWSDWLEFKAPNKVCRYNTQTCASIRMKRNTLYVDWPTSLEKFYPTKADFIYVWDE